MTQFDLFVSYRRQDGDRVLPLVEALRGRGLSVWFDQDEFDDFTAITDGPRARGLQGAARLVTQRTIPRPAPARWS